MAPKCCNCHKLEVAPFFLRQSRISLWMRCSRHELSLGYEILLSGAQRPTGATQQHQVAEQPAGTEAPPTEACRNLEQNTPEGKQQWP